MCRRMSCCLRLAHTSSQPPKPRCWRPFLGHASKVLKAVAEAFGCDPLPAPAEDAGPQTRPAEQQEPLHLTAGTVISRSYSKDSPTLPIAGRGSPLISECRYPLSNTQAKMKCSLESRAIAKYNSRPMSMMPTFTRSALAASPSASAESPSRLLIAVPIGRDDGQRRTPQRRKSQNDESYNGLEQQKPPE